MVGFIESISADRRTMSGWVRVDTLSRLPNIRVLGRDGTSFGAVEVGPERGDVTNRTGVHNRRFTAWLPFGLPPGALITGECSVVAEILGSEMTLPSVGSLVADEASLLVYAAERAVGRGGVSDLPLRPSMVTGNERPSGMSAMSYLPFPVGLRSGDGSAVLGHGGHIFLTGGSNDLAARYKEPGTSLEAQMVVDQANQWRNVFAARAESCSALGALYVQTVIPEKSTVMHELLDGVSGPTPVMRQLESKMRDSIFYVSAIDALATRELPPAEPFLHHDSHLSSAGALTLLRSLLPAMGVDISTLATVELAHTTLVNGDLGRRFFGMELWGPDLEPVDVWPWHSREIRPVEVVDPSNHGHIGRRRRWVNPSAPVDASVLVFGNSFFGAGQAAGKLSWWFSRLFKAYEFVWDPSFDFDRVGSSRPDVVVGQTIERFLGKVPSDRSIRDGRV